MTPADFLAAIIARPDDDLPRLAFADWLDEHDEPDRAEFIRVQCELATLGGACYPRGRDHARRVCVSAPEFHHAGCPATALRRRERELFGQVAMSFPALGSDEQVRLDQHASCGRSIEMVVRRGFVSEISLSWADWLAHATALLGACPIARVDRAPRRTCPFCYGDGIGSSVTSVLSCGSCKGYGTLPAETPDWRGDGLVRLADMPPFVADDSGPAVILWNDGTVSVNLQGVGRRRVQESAPRVFDGREVVLSILEDKWRGVKFELPAVPHPASGMGFDGNETYGSNYASALAANDDLIRRVAGGRGWAGV